MAYMLNRKCRHPECPDFIIGPRGVCSFCGGIRCETHMGYPYHKCDWYWDKHKREQTKLILKISEEKLFARTLSYLNESALIVQAQALRPGHTCTIKLPEQIELPDDHTVKMFDAMNIHFPLEFDDGVKWVVRARQAHFDRPPPKIQATITRSEVATMKVLHRAGLPVPDAWVPLPPTPSLYQTDHFFAEFISGRNWLKNAPLTTGQIDQSTAATFIASLASFHDIASKCDLGVECIGSLQESSKGKVTVGPLIDGIATMVPEPPHFLGPFKTQKERYLAQTELALNNIFDGHLWRKRPLHAFLTFLAVSDMVDNSTELAKEETCFYVKHGDERNSQYLVADDGKITGILDWEWSFVTTKSQAFAAPPGLYGAPPYYTGSNDLTQEEEMLIEAHITNNRHDLADCVRNGRLYQRLKDIFIPDGTGYPPDITTVNGLRAAFAPKGQVQTTFKTGWEWREFLLPIYQNDPRVQELLARDEADTPRRLEESRQIRKRAAKQRAAREARAAEEEQAAKDKG